MYLKFITICLLATVVSCHSAQKITRTLQEPHRPVYHFTPPQKWMNDPNGMVFYDGEYHLFYQHYPDSTVWGPMHWGHAVSRDLVRWEHLPIALYPDELGMIFSGSAVVDWKNTSGFGTNAQPPLVAMYTQHLMEAEKAGRNDFQYQSIAWSNDKGRTWTKYGNNPVVPNKDQIRDFRDPKVIWDADSKQWILVFAAQNHVKLWASPDLKNWKHLSDFGRTWGSHAGVWECPDLFPIYVGATKEKKWVLLLSINPGAPNSGSGTQYFVGHFDGKSFTLDPDFARDVTNENGVWLDWGRDNYAGVTWSDIPVNDGRRIFLGWMSNWDYAQITPTQNWRSAMTIPRQLTLVPAASSYRLRIQPVRELQTLRQKSAEITPQTITHTLDIGAQTGISAAAMELKLNLEWPENTQGSFTIALANAQGETYRIGFDGTTNQFFSDRSKAGKTNFSPKFPAQLNQAPRQQTGKNMTLHLFFDRASCELFADEGATVITETYFPNSDFTQIRLETNSGPLKIVSGTAHALGIKN